jgi:spermidine/putrescine transport system permease protein
VTVTNAASPQTTPAAPAKAARRPFWRNPWRHPWFLESFTWLYLVWSLVPIVIAVLFSFNNGKSQSTWQGFSWRWYFSDPVNSVWHDPQLHAAVIQTVRLSVLTTVIAVPLGVAFALGINRWRGPVPATFTFVIPELIFGVSMFFVFTTLFSSVHLGTLAEVLGLVTWNVSWPAIVVQARLVTIGRHY